MKISGFSFVKNGVKLYYPIKEAIQSILPICDEFVVAVGEGDSDDNTREVIESIDSTKVKIIDTVWDKKFWKKGAINAIQTDIAKNACSGDWLFYVQADEVVHEKYLPIIKDRCKELLERKEVEGLVFDYFHFWGDYNHYHKSHGWYPHEIRIIRNLPEIHSWQSAQSFRYWNEKYEHPHQETETRKLNVAKANAAIYHYGWVRPPELMASKNKALGTVHHGEKKAQEEYDRLAKEFDYGPLNNLAVFKGSQPKVMKKMISEFNWESSLQYEGKPSSYRELHKHEKLKYRIVSWIEQNIMGGKHIGEFKNYNLLKNVK